MHLHELKAYIMKGRPHKKKMLHKPYKSIGP